MWDHRLKLPMNKSSYDLAIVYSHHFPCYTPVMRHSSCSAHEQLHFIWNTSLQSTCVVSHYRWCLLLTYLKQSDIAKSLISSTLNENRMGWIWDHVLMAWFQRISFADSMLRVNLQKIGWWACRPLALFREFAWNVTKTFQQYELINMAMCSILSYS